MSNCEYHSDVDEEAVAPSAGREARRRRLPRLLGRGSSLAEIAEELGVSPKVIRNDLRVLRERSAEFFSEFSREVYLCDTLALLQDIEQKAIRLFNELPLTHPGRIQALREMRSARKDGVALVQDLGLLATRPEPAKTVHIDLSKTGLSRADIDRLAQAIILAEHPELRDMVAPPVPDPQE